ncbi:MAG: TonB-dependent receptor [Gammaproteobacteria bacterium]|nr:TonB-dependent receptor [Gammaproteobacteria bacterium]
MIHASIRAGVRDRVCLTLSGVLLFGSVSALAQSSSAIEEVVVTAQRTEQSLQEVPIAVTAFSGAMMEDKQIISPSDLQLNAPNVSYTDTNFGGSSFSIRGIGRLVIAGSGENGVSIHQNQIAVPTNLPAAEFYDLERVEVLRGPQGTLFGKNATGGAINMVTKMPDFESWNGFVDGEAGDYSNKRIKGALNMPFGDRFAVRVAGMWLERDGYIENTAYGQTGDCLIPGSTIDNQQTQPCQISGIDDDVDGRDITTFRVTGLWQVSDNASAWVQYSRFKEDDDKVRITNQVCEKNTIPTIGCLPDGFGFDTPHAGTTTGGIFGGLNGAVLLGDPSPTKAFSAPSTGFRKMHTDYEPIYKYDEDLWTAGFDYDFENYRVGLLAGYHESQYVSRQDYLMDVGFNLYASPLNPGGLWPTSAPPELEAGSDWTSSECNFNDGTSGIFGGCVHPSDQTRVFAYDSATSDTEYWTVEAKLESAYTGPLNFIVGANYSEYKGHGDYYVIANTLDLVGNYGVPGLGFPPLYPTMFNSTSNPSGKAGNTGDSASAFGELYYDVTDSFKVTMGLRYNRDKKEVEDTGILFNAINAEAVGATLPGFLVGFGLLDPDYLTNSAAGRGAGGINWTRTLNFLLGGLGDPAAAENELELARYHGATDAQIADASATPAYSAARFEVSSVVPFAPGFGENRALTGSPSEAKFTETTGRIGFDWQLGDATMVYGFFTRGYKPGGFNPPLNQSFVEATTAKYIFDPEQVDSIEFGAKSAWLDGSLVANVAAFIYDYQGLQTTRIANNNSINDNIDADIWGLELETYYRPAAIPNLSIDMAYSYLNAEVSDTASVDPINRTAGNDDFVLLENIDPGSLTGVNYVANRGQITQAHIDEAYSLCRALSAQNPLNGAGCPGVAPGTTYGDGLPAYFSRGYLNGTAVDGTGSPLNTVGVVETNDGFETDLDGNTLPNSPEHTVHLGVAYTWPIDRIAGSLTARWDYYWQSESYAREFNTPGDKIDSWDQHNASLIYESSNGLWSARAFVRNLQDDDNVTGKYLTSDTSGFYRNYFLTEPRIYGASVRYSFDNAR